MIDPNSAVNAGRLLPGRWTYPAAENPTVSIGQDVDLGEPELRSDISFAWDFQFYPEYIGPNSDRDAHPGCNGDGNPRFFAIAIPDSHAGTHGNTWER